MKLSYLIEYNFRYKVKEVAGSRAVNYMPKQTKEPPNPLWTNVLHHFAKSTLENLHEQLFGDKGEGKNKLELADSVAVHRLGIEILKKQGVYVDQLRGVLVRNAGMNAMEARALKKDEPIDKLRGGELQVELPSPAGVANPRCRPRCALSGPEY